MKNNKRKSETTKTDNGTLLLEQIKHLNALIERLESKPSIGGHREKESEIEGDLKFTQKEIKEMTRLKDFKIRKKNIKYYEIRFRRYGYNVSFSSTNFEEAKRKAFAWLDLFEQEIQINYNFAVVKKDSKTESGASKKNTTFGPFALSYMQNVKKRMVKENTYRNIMNAFKKHILSTFKKYPIKVDYL